jgi:hypothetical protein
MTELFLGCGNSNKWSPSTSKPMMIENKRALPKLDILRNYRMSNRLVWYFAVKFELCKMSTILSDESQFT